MKLIAFLIWLLIWTVGHISLENLLKINIGWKIMPISVFCATMGMILFSIY